MQVFHCGAIWFWGALNLPVQDPREGLRTSGETRQARSSARVALPGRPRLLVISGRCRGEEETVWVMQSLMHDQLMRKVDFFSKTTLQLKHGPISVAILRKKLLDGLVGEFLAPASVTVQEALTAKPGLADVHTALKQLEEKYATVNAYQKAKAEDTPISGLPAWGTVHFNRLARQIMDGQKDKALLALCMKPPAGGVASMTYSSHLRSVESFATQIEALETQHKEWVANIKGENVGRELPTTSTVAPQPTGAEGQESLTDSQIRLASLRGEMSAVAKEIRVAYVPMVPIGDSALSTEKAWKDDNNTPTPTLAGAHPGPRIGTYLPPARSAGPTPIQAPGRDRCRGVYV